MSEQTSARLVVPASVTAVRAVLAALEEYPAWVPGMRQVTVLATGADGLPTRARFVADAGALKDTYVLDYVWGVADDDGSAGLSWTLAESRALRVMDGAYALTPHGADTLVSYRLTVEPIVPLPGLLRRRAEKTVVTTALAGLRDHVGRTAGGGAPA